MTGYKTQHSILNNSLDVNSSTVNEIGEMGSVAKIQRAMKPVSSRLSAYLVALRPWSFAASLVPVALGSCLAFKVLGTFNIWAFLTTCVTALSVHAAGNLVNTYYDFTKGVDSKDSDDVTLVGHVLTVNDIVTLGGIFYTVGCLGFLLLIHLSPSKMEHLALIYFGGLSSSFLYTGGLALKYIALGDITVFFTFGPLTVLFAYLAQGGSLSALPLLYAIPLALNTACILHANNTRDMESDKAAGIVTLAIILGPTGSYLLFVFLLFIPYIMLIPVVVNYSKWFILPLLSIFPTFNHERAFRQKLYVKLPNKLAKLNLQLGMFFVLALYLTATSKLPLFMLISGNGTESPKR